MTDKTTANIKLRRGKNSEMALAEKFLSEEQFQNYKANKKFKNSKEKKKFLSDLSRCCDYEYNSQAKLIYIRDIYKIPIPKIFDKLNDGVSRYLVPLILRTLIEERDSHDNGEIPIDKYLTFTDWARKINMVNDNYRVVKFNYWAISEIHGFYIGNIETLMSRLTDCINYRVQQALERLKDCGVIEYHKETIIHVEEFKNIMVVGKTIQGEKCEIKRRATSDEKQFILQCEGAADKVAGIASTIDSEDGREKSGTFKRYFGSKAFVYRRSLKKGLALKNIKRAYDAYAVFMVGRKKCIDFLDLFSVTDFDEFTVEFNNFLKAFIENGCNRRLDRKFENFLKDHPGPTKVIVDEQIKREKARQDYNLLTDMLINQDAESVVPAVRKYQAAQNLSGNNTEDNYTVNMMSKGVRTVN